MTNYDETAGTEDPQSLLDELHLQASARGDATAWSPASGSVLAALWAISSAGSTHVSIC